MPRCEQPVRPESIATYRSFRPGSAHALLYPLGSVHTLIPSTPTRSRVLAHLDTSIKEIQIALSINQ